MNRCVPALGGLRRAFHIPIGGMMQKHNKRTIRHRYPFDDGKSVKKPLKPKEKTDGA